MLNFRPDFLRRPDSLTLPDARYFQDLLYRAVKIGTELEFALPKGVLRQEFQPRIVEALQPSGDMNQLGELGVYDVIREHCGIEILVIGRIPTGMPCSINITGSSFLCWRKKSGCDLPVVSISISSEQV